MKKERRRWIDPEGLQIIDNSIHTKTEYSDTRRWDSWVEPNVTVTETKFIDRYGEEFCTALALEADWLRIPVNEDTNIHAYDGSYHLSGDMCPTDDWNTHGMIFGDRDKKIKTGKEFDRKYFSDRWDLDRKGSDRLCKVCPKSGRIARELPEDVKKGGTTRLRFAQNGLECSSQRLIYNHWCDTDRKPPMEIESSEKHGKCIYKNSEGNGK